MNFKETIKEILMLAIPWIVGIILFYIMLNIMIPPEDRDLWKNEVVYEEEN